MAEGKNWILEAAEQIYHGVKGEHFDTSPEVIGGVIAEHCPFKMDTAYAVMDKDVKLDAGKTYILVVGQDGVAAISNPPEPPLLECRDCRNTESCAGAMARQFNHGRCMHCGGYFKVVRA